jgi:tetratricopeptide (TPR) repeat protein
MPMQITQEQLAAYHRDGYLVVENLVSPDMVEALRKRLREYTHEGRPLGSISVQAHNNIADLYELQGRWKEAIEHYHKALQISPNLAASYAGLGDLYRKNGVWAKAVENYQKAVELDSTDILSQRFIAPCRQAAQEQESRGFVSAETLRQLALVETMFAMRHHGHKTAS